MKLLSKTVKFFFIILMMLFGFSLSLISAWFSENGCGEGEYMAPNGECYPVGPPPPPPPPPCDDSCNGSCSGTCPSGYTKTNPNNLCSSQTVWAGCSYQNDCGHGCSGGQNCYRLETNIAPKMTPSSLSMNIDGITYVLSTNVSSPTVIKRPKDPNVNIFVNPTIAPNASINRGVGYSVNLTANGTNKYVESTSNKIPFPLSPASSYLLNGTSGHIRGRYYSINRCDNNKLYSPERTGYYKVNRPPVRTGITYKRNGNNISLSIAGQDPDGNPLRGAIFWLTTTGATYTTQMTTISSGVYQGSNATDLAIMILSDQKVYVLNNDRHSWSYVGLGRGTIKNSSGVGVFNISNVSTTSNSSGTYGFILQPLRTAGMNFCNNYALYGTLLDQYNIVNAGTAGNYTVRAGSKIDLSTNQATSGTYKLETNIPPTAPTLRGTLQIDSVKYPNVSISSSSPTKVKKPATETSSKYTLPNLPLPIGSRAVNTYTTPSTFPKSIFPEGQVRSIKEVYQTLNRCDNNWLTTTRDVYYKTNITPSITPPPPGGGPDSGGSGHIPPGYDPNCQMLPDQECTIATIIENYGGKDSRTKIGGDESNPNAGCRSLTYTGLEVNNPLKIALYGNDPDGNENLKGAVIWFSKGNVKTGIVDITPTYTHTTNNEIGIMILSQGSSPKLYAITADGKFAPLPDSKIKRSDGSTMLDITDVSIANVSGRIKYSATLTFIENATNNPSGIYGFNAKIIDTHMLGNTWVDMSDVKRYFNWGIDLVKPQIDTFKHNVLDVQNINLNWSLSDTVTKIQEYVINAYRSDQSSINTSISMVGMPNPLSLASGTPDEKDIGNLGADNQWEFRNVNSTPVSGVRKVNTSTNEGGSINFYLTAFDQACNYIVNSSSVNLEPWIATKGGTIYSKGTILLPDKDLSSVDDSFYTLNGQSTLKRITKGELHIGSEVISSSSKFITNLLMQGKKSSRALNAVDSNTYRASYFDTLRKNLNKQQDNITKIDNINGCSGQLDRCVYYTTSDVVIPSGYECNKSILIMSEGNITIEPNVVSDGKSLHGCIFLAKNNVSISEGVYSSGSVVGYDNIDGFVMAGNKVNVAFADSSKVIRDGLYIYGGLIGMGGGVNELNLDKAVTQSRSLKLFNDINPSLIIVHDSRYSKISELFFGKESIMFKKEIGYKPY